MNSTFARNKNMTLKRAPEVPEKITQKQQIADLWFSEQNHQIMNCLKFIGLKFSDCVINLQSCQLEDVETEYEL